MALRKAGVTPDQVDYINAHGTSTPYNDKLETLAIKNCFGEHATRSSSRRRIDDRSLLGGAGGLEAVSRRLAVFHQACPPRSSRQSGIRRCDLDYVSHTSRQLPIRYALSNSFGSAARRGAAVQEVRGLIDTAPRRPRFSSRMLVPRARARCRETRARYEDRCLYQTGSTREWQPSQRQDLDPRAGCSFEMNEPMRTRSRRSLRLREKHSGESSSARRAGANAAGDREALARGADRALHVEDEPGVG
jgi:hypothetical protein